MKVAKYLTRDEWDKVANYLEMLSLGLHSFSIKPHSFDLPAAVRQASKQESKSLELLGKYFREKYKVELKNEVRS